MTKRAGSFCLNAKVARTIWGQLTKTELRGLKWLTQRYALSVATGDVQFLDGRWYVTHAGLLRIAQCRRCSGIRTTLQRDLCDAAANRWVFKATVYKSPESKGFVGYGDADPSNVSPLVRGAEMRVAETRAVNRALRKAYGIGLCSVEELKWLSGSSEPIENREQQNQAQSSKGSNDGHPRLRDRLCLLIRRHCLNPSLVKQYAADFCGTPTLKEASRDTIESFITHLTEWAKRDRDGLICKLNSYVQPSGARS